MPVPWCVTYRHSFYAAIILISSIFFSLPAWSASVDIGRNIRIFIPLKSFKDLRDQSLVKQAHDYSCGAAALATLLTYVLRDPVTEADILLHVRTGLSKEEETLRKTDGILLSDLRRVARERGHRADGFRLAPEFLLKLPGPVIVFIKPPGNEHYTVFKGIRDDRVYLADPSFGNIRMSIDKFLSMWLEKHGKGIIFVVERMNDHQEGASPLRVSRGWTSRPEVLSARELLEFVNPYIRFPQLIR